MTMKITSRSLSKLREQAVDSLPDGRRVRVDATVLLWLLDHLQPGTVEAEEQFHGQ